MASTQQSYRPDIDGLRAVSILFALIYHGFAKDLPGGFIGADIFFVISGYLITKQIYEQAKSGKFSFLNFYSRRIRRIFPPLILILIFVGIYGYFRLNLTDFTSLFKHIAAGTVFFSNFALWQEIGYFDQRAVLKPLLHLWSLAIEEQFYLLWPLLIVALTVASRRYRSATFWALIFICAISLATRVHLAKHDAIAAFYSPLSRFWELGLGGLLAVIEVDQIRLAGFSWGKYARNIATIAGTACLAFCAVLLSGQDHFPSLLAILPALSAMAIIAAGPETIINRALCYKPMVQLGLISYALYLWHWPLLSFIHIAGIAHNSSLPIWLALAVSVVLAAITRTLVEQPIRKSRARPTPIWLIATLASIGIIGVLGFNTKLLWPERMPLQAGIQEQIKTAWREYNADGIPSSDCAEFLAVGSSAYQNCHILGGTNPTRTIVVWGDSMAIAWMPPFFSMARDKGWRVIQFTHTGCPAIVGVHRTDRNDLECRSAILSTQIVEAIRRIKPDIVFLIGRWNLFYYGHIKNDILVEPTFITDGTGKATAESAKASFTRRMPETINLLSEFSHLVVFKDTPVMKVPVDVGVTTRPDTFEPRLIELKNFESEIDRVIDSAVERAPNAVVFDPTKRLCNAIKCPGYIDGLPAYFDEVHLTAHAAMQFLPDIESLGAAQ